MNYKIGLDLGISSVGWAALLLDENDEPVRILDMNTHIFKAAEEPKTGESLAKVRREARSARRRLRRKKHRISRIKHLIAKNEILSLEEIENIYQQQKQPDVYKLRVEALDRKLTKEEFVRVLIHIAQRRGFISNRKVANAGGKAEKGKLKTAASDNMKLMETKGYRTVGEMMLLDERFSDYKRNKNNDYSHTNLRELMVEEIKKIFTAQRDNGNTFADKKFEQKYLEIFNSQRDFSEGPGKFSPYGGNQIEKSIGYCTFEKSEKRAPKASFHFEYFNLLQKVNNITICQNGNKRTLTEEERKIIIAESFKREKINYLIIRQKIKLPECAIFGNITYSTRNHKLPVEEIRDENERKINFFYLKAYHTIRKTVDKVTFKGRYLEYPDDFKDNIGYALTVFKKEDKIREFIIEYSKMYKFNISEDEINALLEIEGFNKFSNLSLKTIKRLIPFLEKGEKYSQAVKMAGYNEFHVYKSGKKSKFLTFSPEIFDEILNPVVKRSLSRALKVLNAIIRRYGSPSSISIELAREMSKSFEQRNKIKKRQLKNYENNLKTKEILKKDYGILNPTNYDILKLKLWEEQNKKCLYSQKIINKDELFGYNIDIDHIIPYSISFDDSFNNKALVFSKENRQKGNKLPLEYLKGKKRENYIENINLNIKNFKKKEKLLKTRITEEEINSFKNRNLSDTQYISRFFSNYIRENLIFADNNGRKKTVYCINGTMTSILRNKWNITKNRYDGDIHHAIDALVIACISDKTINKIVNWYKYDQQKNNFILTEIDGKEIYINTYTGETTESPLNEKILKASFPLPWKNFKEEAMARMSLEPRKAIAALSLATYDKNEEILPIIISRMPNRKIKGAAHKETIYSAKEIDNGIIIKRTPITKLSLDKKTGEIKDYYRPKDDPNVYLQLKNRLIEFDGDAEKAFEKPIYKKRKDGSNGSIIKTVKTFEKTTLFVPVNKGNGAALNDTMLRIDIFFIENKYHFVPIYVADTLKERLPNQAVSTSKNGWIEVFDENFLFSLCKDDLIYIEYPKGWKFTNLYLEKSTLPPVVEKTEDFVYYSGADISSNRISIDSVDGVYSGRIALGSCKMIEKYQIDLLGNYSKVKKERRQSFSFKHKQKIKL